MHVKMYKPPSSRMKKTNGRSQGHLRGPRHPATTPDVRPLEHRPSSSCTAAKHLQAPDIRPRQPGHPALPELLDIRPPAWKSGPRHSREQQGWTLPARTSGPSTRTSGVSGRPGHPARRPDIRPPCLRAAHLGHGPCTPSPLRLYILPLHLRFRVSVVIAHLRDRASLIHIGSTPRERPRALCREDPLGFNTPSRRRSPHGYKTTARRRTGYLCVVLS